MAATAAAEARGDGAWIVASMPFLRLGPSPPLLLFVRTRGGGGGGPRP